MSRNSTLQKAIGKISSWLKDDPSKVSLKRLEDFKKGHRPIEVIHTGLIDLHQEI